MNKSLFLLRCTISWYTDCGSTWNCLSLHNVTNLLIFQFQSLLTYILYKTIKPCMNECSNTAILLLCIIITTTTSLTSSLDKVCSTNTQNIHKKLAHWSQEVTTTSLHSPEHNYIRTYNLIMHFAGNTSKQAVNSALRWVKTKQVQSPVQY